MNNIEISYQEYLDIRSQSTVLVDMRTDMAAGYGMLPDARHIEIHQLDDKTNQLRGFDNVVLYCTKGEHSLNAAEKLRDMGFNAYSLKGGYNGWLTYVMSQDKTESEDDEIAEFTAQIEAGLRKRYKKSLFSKFAKAINTYDMLQPGDKVAVCISGGKDSMLMAKLFQELKRHGKFEFDLVFMVMDPGYNEMNRQVIEHTARIIGIPITVFESDIFDAVLTVDNSPCYLCARMRRGHLYAKAKELGCNKIALGHHYDDVIETILMGMLYGAQVQTMMPKLHSSNFEGMELIRPLYLIREDDIKRWRDENGLHFIQCACKMTDTCNALDPEGHAYSKRLEVKNLIATMKKDNPYVEGNIFKSVENVNLSTVIAYKQHGVKHHFLDNYDSMYEEGGE